ncbi:MAG: hypothetical protein KGZ86_03645 [Candidatus Latescibacteria bacterium]|nr:hypothetical protein [Candidatus Latescibacterota bacterium]
MTTKTNPAPDSTKVTLTLNLGQVKLLEKLVDSTLADVEEFGEYEGVKKKALETLWDQFWKITRVPLTPEEEKARMDAWKKEYTHKGFIAAHGFDPLEEREVQS